MKKLILIWAVAFFATSNLTAQQLLNLKAPETPIDTTAEVLGFAQSSNCMRFSMPLYMPGYEGSIQLETGGNGYAYIYSGGSEVVSLSITSCTTDEGYEILNLNPSSQQGNIDKMYRIILVPNGNYSCRYSPIIFDFGDDTTESFYCTF
jgi:hypothetical protein